LGNSGRKRVETTFSVDACWRQLYDVLESVRLLRPSKA